MLQGEPGVTASDDHLQAGTDPWIRVPQVAEGFTVQRAGHGAGGVALVGQLPRLEHALPLLFGMKGLRIPGSGYSGLGIGGDDSAQLFPSPLVGAGEAEKLEEEESTLQIRRVLPQGTGQGVDSLGEATFTEKRVGVHVIPRLRVITQLHQRHTPLRPYRSFSLRRRWRCR